MVEKSTTPEYRTATEFFERILFPEAILLGMPSDEFWYGDPRRLLSYIEANRLKMKRKEAVESKTIDYQAWLTGLYCYQAFGTVASNAFSKGKKAQYPKKPISMSKSNNGASSKRTEEEQLFALYAGFKHQTDAMNAKFKDRR